MRAMLRRSSFAAVLLSTAAFALGAEPPAKVGEMAKDFKLASLDKSSVELKALTSKGPVVLLVLRGYPGYQCPLCTRQVQDYLKSEKEFAKHQATVVMVYPGAANKLDQYAKEFIQGSQFPANFRFVTDPDYGFTNAYGLRWDAPAETAYPSTFIIDSEGKIQFARISKSHAGRTRAADALEALENLAGR